MRVNKYNSEAIIAAQKAYTECKCAACTDSSVPLHTCKAGQRLHAELERGEDMYLAAHGVPFSAVA